MDPEQTVFVGLTADLRAPDILSSRGFFAVHA